ncbi:MAG: tetratricopeptide repeat protein, partial [Chloroflexi bacterium]
MHLPVMVRSDRNYAKAWNRRGNVLNELGNRVEALNSYEQAILIDKRYLSAWNGKASVLSQLERYSEALSAYDYVLNLNPN